MQAPFIAVDFRANRLRRDFIIFSSVRTVRAQTVRIEFDPRTRHSCPDQESCDNSGRDLSGIDSDRRQSRDIDLVSRDSDAAIFAAVTLSGNGFGVETESSAIFVVVTAL